MAVVDGADPHGIGSDGLGDRSGLATVQG